MSRFINMISMMEHPRKAYTSKPEEAVHEQPSSNHNPPAAALTVYAPCTEGDRQLRRTLLRALAHRHFTE